MLVNLQNHLCDICKLINLVNYSEARSSNFFFIPSPPPLLQQTHYFFMSPCLVYTFPTTWNALLFLIQMLSSYSSCKTHLDLTSVKPSLASSGRDCHFILCASRAFIHSSVLTYTREFNYLSACPSLPLDCDHLKGKKFY